MVPAKSLEPVDIHVLAEFWGGLLGEEVLSVNLRLSRKVRVQPVGRFF